MPTHTRVCTVRIPVLHYIALVKLAERKSATVGGYLRDYVVKEHLRQKHNARPGVDHLSPFIRTVKEFIITWRGVSIASSLPAEPKRKKLEELTWQAIEQAYAYSQTTVGLMLGVLLCAASVTEP